MGYFKRLKENTEISKGWILGGIITTALEDTSEGLEKFEDYMNKKVWPKAEHVADSLDGRKKPFNLSNIIAHSDVNYLRKGQILGVRRFNGAIIHYGIYIGNREVIHFSSPSDVSNNSIIRTKLSGFLKGETYCFVVNIENSLLKSKINPPLTTVERAKEKLGEKGYNLLFNNCEHFAFWCKTGRKISTQDFIMPVFKPLSLPKTLIKFD